MEKRKFHRFNTQLPGTYTVTPGGTPRECRVTDVSREGTRIEMLTGEQIDPSTSLQLIITLPSESAPIKSTLTLKWIQELDPCDGFKYLAGGFFEDIDLEDKWRLLDYAYDRFKQAKGKQ